jgi:hypothetical protein
MYILRYKDWVFQSLVGGSPVFVKAWVLIATFYFLTSVCPYLSIFLWSRTEPAAVLLRSGTNPAFIILGWNPGFLHVSPVLFLYFSCVITVLDLELITPWKSGDSESSFLDSTFAERRGDNNRKATWWSGAGTWAERDQSSCFPGSPVKAPLVSRLLLIVTGCS